MMSPGMRWLFRAAVTVVVLLALYVGSYLVVRAVRTEESARMQRPVELPTGLHVTGTATVFRENRSGDGLLYVLFYPAGIVDYAITTREFWLERPF